MFIIAPGHDQEIINNLAFKTQACRFLLPELVLEAVYRDESDTGLCCYDTQLTAVVMPSRQLHTYQ